MQRLRSSAAEGQGMVEYALLLALIALAVIGIIAVFAPEVFNAVVSGGNFGSGADFNPPPATPLPFH